MITDKSALTQLEHAISRFRDWANGYDHAYQYGEWECDYDEWPAIYTAFQTFLNEFPYQKWSAEIVNLLVYVIARDNECGILADKVAKKPERIIFLARASLNSPENDAKWQIAVNISRLIGHNAEVEPLLLEFAKDENEYVRRQALMGLGRINSPAVEKLAEVAWETGDEYQRIGVLNALHGINSPRLAEFRDRAVEDGRKYLVDYAQRTRLEPND